MNKWKETLTILITAISFVTIILFIQTEENDETDFITRIPKTTTEHYLLNTSALFKKLVFNELFMHKDQVIIQRIKELISKETKTEINFTDLSINFSAPLEIIRFQLNGKLYTVMKFKISNSSNFDQNKKKLTKELIFRDELNGFWVIGKLKNELSYIQKFILKNSFTYKMKNDQTKQIISTFRNSKLETTNQFELSENQIIIKRISDKEAKTYMCLKPKGFHLSTTVNSSQLAIFQDNEVSKQIRLKDIEHLSINYSGLYFIDNSEIQAIPKFEILLRYKYKISGKAILCRILNHYNLPFESKSINEFRLANELIKIKQIDTNQFVVSTLDEYFELKKTGLSPYITGDPKNIVKISNAGWKGLFLELIPAFKTSKNLLESTNKISTYQNKQGYHIICLSFKKNEDALHSLLKFALNLQ